MNLADLTEEQLDVVAHELDAQRREALAPIVAQMHAVQAERDHRAAVAKLASLSPFERALLATRLAPAGIESEAKTGTPGK